MADEPAGDAEPRCRPLLTVEQQIAHLKSKGVTFELCSEKEAADYLHTGNNLLRTSSYRKLFATKRQGPHSGEYAGLDFEHLRTLSSLDRQLRQCFLDISIDIEHFARVRVLDQCEAQGEDGYQIVRDYMAQLNHGGRNHLEGGLKARGSNGLTRDEYSGGLIAKHLGGDEHIDRMPVWVLLETVEFRAFNDFFLFCAQRWGDETMLRQHYVLKSVRAMRNACAHNACIVNGVGQNAGKCDTRTNELVTGSLNAHGMKRSKSRRAKLSNLRVSQMAATLYADSMLCPRESTRERHAAALGGLRLAWSADEALFAKNPAVTSFFDFFFKLVDIWMPGNA